MEQFYKYFNINPAQVLTDCEFYNLAHYGTSYGEDYCDHLEEEEFKCKDCDKIKHRVDWYPVIEYEIWFRLSLLRRPDIEPMGTINITQLMNFYMSQQDIFSEIQEILQAYVDEFKRS